MDMLIKNVFTFLFACFFAVSVSAEPQLTVQLDRSAIYEGETFVYQLVLSDTSPHADTVIPDTSVWTDFNIQPLPRQTSSSTTIINWNTTATHSTRFSYVLTPKRTGTFTIPLPKVTVNGKVLQPQKFVVDEGDRQILADYSVVARVIEPDKQDIVFMSIETNRNRLYPLQPLEVTLVVQIKGLPGRFADTNPLTLLRPPPQLQIPWASVENVPRGFHSTQKLEQWLSNLLVRSPQRGFAINDYASSGLDDRFNMPFSMGDLFQKVPLQFSSTPRQIQRPDAQGNKTTYWEYRFSRTFIPQEFGHYAFGPVTLKGALPVVTDANVPDGIAAQRFYAIAKPAAVAVVDVPQENRPADYIGAFGSFHWDVNLAPQQARVGDPITLTLRLSGQGSTANVRPTDLSANLDVATNFRVHMPPTEEIDEKSCTFTYTIRPLNSGEIMFPSISVSVFDVNTERFVSLPSQPISLNIADSESVQSPTLFGGGPGGNVQLLEGGLFANKTTFSEMFPPITFVQWAVVISLLVAGYAAIALGVLLLQCQWSNPKQQRRRNALSRAKSRLANISTTLRGGNAANLVEISSELQGGFFGYIADKLDGAEQGMTTSDACRQLLEHRVPESLVDTIRSALESLDAVKYGGMDIRSLDELTNTTSMLLQQLDRSQWSG